MNIYYAPPSQINNGFAELLDQEAKHISKVMRAREGDRLTIVDGQGGRYQGSILMITNDAVQVKIDKSENVPPSDPRLVLGMGIIKKRDRLEFAVEKAIELGVSEIGLFRSERTIKKNVRMDRLESIAVSAMKQSLQVWLPTITMYHTLDDFLASYTQAEWLVAHEKVEKQDHSFTDTDSDTVLLLVGPEGGFSPSEIDKLTDGGATTVSLGENRLRTETAVTAFLSQFLIQ
ncbi:RsmE family RNA methyltransferase [Fodinibius halophilus]|uniref:Ribosomal RNA small subunit methyltransferase E n=1 Tax=Fodinibius halophilus TaxID=1736908 RepID=A0A6M1T3B7_9BACT|nr:RsmE family RNA methyltransferase [Fodinibius halophilus]NGP88559.1 16S rRNA (uracil(1498)-N(3))-methyltransferase [Fodinibius halophilus]